MAVNSALAGSIPRAGELAAELRAALPKLLAAFPLHDEQDKGTRARMIDGRQRALSDWIAARSLRGSNGDDSAWRLPPCPSHGVSHVPVMVWLSP